MEKQYKYDIAFSCAEEDLPVAQKIATILKEKGISYYLYTEHEAEHLGLDIFKITMDKYSNEARYILMLISESYIEKRWSGIERQIAQTVKRREDAYIIPIHLGDKPITVEGLSGNIVYRKWNDNSEEIVDLIKKKIAGTGNIPATPLEKITTTITNHARVINNITNLDQQIYNLYD